MLPVVEGLRRRPGNLLHLSASIPSTIYQPASSSTSAQHTDIDTPTRKFDIQGSKPMSGFLSFLTTIVLPALFALAIYLVLSFLILPLYRRHRQRYSQYLPLNTISTTTNATSSFLRERLLTWIFLPTTWTFQNRSRFSARRPVSAEDGEGDENSLFGSDEGEDMVGFDVQDEARRRDAMDRNSTNQPMSHPIDVDSGRRLSRELEEGFRDDSDDDDDHGPRSEPDARR